MRRFYDKVAPPATRMRADGSSWHAKQFGIGLEQALNMDAKDLVAAVRAASIRHGMTWEALVPDRHRVDFNHEEAEELAYAEMAAAKGALRDHICHTYGLTVRELNSLASV